MSDEKPIRLEPRSAFQERSARIKRVFIELHDYSFFHNPSDIGNVDDRFIGRAEISSRLRTILTSHQTKSGSYLVTGYRGVGKSSLVSQVLSGISSGESRVRRASRYFRILFPLPLLALLDVIGSPVSRTVFLAVPVVLLLFSLWYLVSKDPEKHDIRRSEEPSAPPGDVTWRERLLHRLGRRWIRFRRAVRRASFKGCRAWIVRAFRATLLMNPDRYPDRRHRTLFQDFLFLSVIQILALVIFHSCPVFTGEPDSLSWRLTVYGGLYILLVILTSLPVTIRRLKRKKDTTASLPAWKAVPRHYWRAITNYINYSHRIYIKANLGQDDLKEIDILRLIARSIHTKYVEFKKFGIADLWWRALYVVMIFFAVGIVYYYQPIYELNLGAKADAHLFQYFPSQISGLHSFSPETIERLVREPAAEEGFHLRGFWKEVEDLGRMVERLEGNRGLREDASEVLDLLDRPDWSLQRATLIATNYADLYTFYLYRSLRAAIPFPVSWMVRSTNGVPSVLVRDLPLHGDFRVIPRYPDHLFLGYLLLVWLTLHLLARRRSFGIVTHDVILRELRDLNDTIDAQVTREEALSGGADGKLARVLIRRRNTKAYPIAGVREIEKRLLEILEEIDRIPRLTVRPNFIFIFDELDKIEPNKNVTLAEEEAEDRTSKSSSALDSIPSSYGAIRERQQRILHLLSNLKHLFTTAKAKFIFIAGREMYDASLADVSDRHFFMGSIFNDVLYVPSFLRDPSDRNLSDVTSLTERYLCQFLLPDNYSKGDFSLRTYHEYLASEIFLDRSGGTEHATEQQMRCRELNRMRRNKVIHLLFEFLGYVTYRSNGAPKKITRILESYVTRPPKEELEDPNNLVVGRSSSSLYLEFGFYDQYTFGLISYLAQPLFLSLHRSNKDFGDKLLVSTSFLLDHLYKFHGFGFSWRNLELLPEIVDVNKAPELRELIVQIMEFLANTHIEEIVSGLHDFKFRKKITEEIAYLSKVSEAESAAFNFTLDESLPIKQYYNRKLRELLRIYKPEPDGPEEAAFIHSLAFVRMILGDLHFYDEEFDQAILEYMEAVQHLQRMEPTRLDTRRLALLIRNLLKLALTFEKKKTYDSAFVLYGALTQAIVEARDIDLKAIGLQTFDLSSKRDDVPDVHLFRRRDLEARGNRRRRRTDSLGSESDFHHILQSLEFGPELAALAYKTAAFEGIQLIYQPLLAKLQVIEKSGLGGISAWDIVRTEREFEFIAKMLHQRVNFLIRAEFKNKVGDILFYKNGPSIDLMRLAETKEPKGKGKSRKSGPTSTLHCRTANSGCLRNDKVETLWSRGLRTPCQACRHTMEGLKLLCENGLRSSAEEATPQPAPWGQTGLLLFLFRALTDPDRFRRRVSVLKEVANLLSDAGDTFLSCAAPKESGEGVHERILVCALDLISFWPGGSDEGPDAREALIKALEDLISTDCDPTLSKADEAILYFILSARFYSVAGLHKSYSHQLTKVLYVIREAVATKIVTRGTHEGQSEDTGGTLGVETMERIEEKLVPRIIRGIYRTYEGTHRMEIEKLKRTFQTDEEPHYRTHSIHLNNLSMARELREAIVILEEIKLSAYEIELKHQAPRPATRNRAGDRTPRTPQQYPIAWHGRFITPYGSVNSMYNRIHELRLRAKENHSLLEGLGGEGLVETHRRWKVDSSRLPLLNHEEVARVVYGQTSPIARNRAPGDADHPAKELEQMVYEVPTLVHLITDSIFAFHEILRCLRVFGLSYMANHLMRATAHEKLADWCDFMYKYVRALEERTEHFRGDDLRKASSIWERIELCLAKLIGDSDFVTLTPSYHYERALLHYRASLQAHTEGRAYKAILETMYYLDDDFSDELTHFCAAAERFRINSGVVALEIERLIEKCKRTRVHRPELYFLGPPDPEDPGSRSQEHMR